MKRMPMFPLGTVLVPGALLPLHIFEARYQALMQDLTVDDKEGDRAFGVVLIERGPEVGGGERRSRIGTVAELSEWQRLPDGRWVALAVGTHRVHIAEWLPDDPYPLAIVEPLPDQSGLAVAEEDLKAAERHVRRCLALAAELGHEVAPITFVLADNPVAALWQLCAAAPLGPLDTQHLLEELSPAKRCQKLGSTVEELASVLAFRLSGE